MNVELIDYQKNALEILLYTKDTRLQGECSLQDILDWPESKKLEHLAYMRNTISSSWEFANYIFKISEVSRAFTHQLVRTRTASFAQESQRTVDVRDATFLIPENVSTDYLYFMSNAIVGYENLIDSGMPVQDARNVLPNGIHTSIIFGANLRTLSAMAELRLCKRTQGEYQDVFKLIVCEIVMVHPWAEEFIQVYCVKKGICAFPNYTECPVQKYTFKIPDRNKEIIKDKWKSTIHVANPIAKDGRTM